MNFRQMAKVVRQQWFDARVRAWAFAYLMLWMLQDEAPMRTEKR